MLKTAKTGSFLLLFSFVLSCQTYNNFRGYYNTYYNAKKSYQSGVEKVQEQPVEIDPDQFISIFPSFPVAGEQDFQQAISNAAQILLRFPDSKWLDSALLLIVKSNYYLHDYFKALQKAEALLGLKQNNEIKQRAAIWKSRVLFQTESHREAIGFLEDQLSTHQTDWSQRQKALIKVCIANNLVRVGDFKRAVDELQPSITYLNKTIVKARAYYLLGQLFSKQKKYNKSYQSFYSVAGYNPGFELAFFSKLKAAEAAARAGHSALANSIYAKMLRDDKNYNRRFQIFYHLGRAAEWRGDYVHANRVYKQILQNLAARQQTDLLAKIYFRLAQLYSKQLGNYQLAVAYFDSSKALRAVERRDVNDKAYGRYLSLRAQIAKIDSLIWLSTLSEAEINSVIKEVKKKNRTAGLLETNDNTFVNNNRENRPEAEAGYSSAFGYLNYKNKQLTTEGIREFKSVWGNRALVDNWRTVAVASATTDADSRTKSTEPEDSYNVTQRQVQPTNLLDEIPFTPEEKQLKRRQKTTLQYQLGNLFFLTLNKPDSAIYYYQKVADSDEFLALIPKALYSLYKLYVLEENTERVSYYKNRLLQDYRDTIYANRLTGRAESVDTAEVLRRELHQIITDSLTTISAAQKLEQLALDHPDSPLASQIYLSSIKKYIKAATAANDTGAVSSNMYSGEWWDKIRSMIKTYPKLYPEGKANKRVETWGEMLAVKAQVLVCKDLEVTPKIAGGMAAFIKKVELPEKLKGMNISGVLTYQILIAKTGQVESFKLISNPTGLGIEEAYSNAISNHLRFEAVLFKGKPVQISCSVDFPINALAD